MTAHGMVDKNSGIWWNLGCGLDTSGTIPKVGYFVMWSDNAGFKAPGEAPSTAQARFLNFNASDWSESRRPNRL